MTPVDPPAIIIEVEQFQRCARPECKTLDRQFPSQGFQLALFPYRVQVRSAVTRR